ncbi:MAG: hypothetical protein M5U26_08105 [Planctomycetota bacterium]|nr:hypothetical protein [Planctomycetota bacterium]
MSKARPPLLLDLILCDHTIREAGSNKPSLIGIFSLLHVTQFPYTHPSFSVYVALSDGRGQVPCRLRLLELEAGREIFALNGSVTFNDPIGVAELIFRLQQLRFERPGEYAMEFIAESELLGARKLRVLSNPT